MNVYKLDSDGIFMYVFANNEDEIKNMTEVKEYYEECEYTTTRLPMHEYLTINFEGVKATLTIEKWIAVRDMGVDVLSVSEH